MKTPEEILQAFGVANGTLEPVAVGHIQKTWKVKADRTYTLQWVNPIFSPNIMEGLVAVTDHMRKKGLTAYEIIRTENGALYVPDTDGFWRLFTYIDGAVYVSVTSDHMAKEAGKLLGVFHAAFADFSHPFSVIRPLHRETAKLFDLYKKSWAGFEGEIDQQFKECLQVIDTLPSLVLPDTLPKRLTHGDPKISNFIFSGDAVPTARAIIDLDDCGNHLSVLVDIGDALRSWCKGQEDVPEDAFSMERCKAALAGYFEGLSGLLTPQERELIPQAFKMIALELACRYARDYVEDTYFAFNSQKYTTRRDHNRVRVLAQVALYKQIVLREKELADYIATLV